MGFICCCCVNKDEDILQGGVRPIQHEHKTQLANAELAENEAETTEEIKQVRAESEHSLIEKYDKDGVLLVQSNIEFPIEYNNASEPTRISTDYIKQMIDFYDTSNYGYEHSIDTPEIQLWVKTDEATKLTLGKMYFSFEDPDGKYQIKDLIDIMFNCEMRKKWDKNVLEFDDIAKPLRELSIYSMAMKSPLPFDNRDFCSKRIVFKSEDKYYIYYSGMPENYWPVKKNMVRAITHFGGVSIKREAGTIRYFQAALSDLKIEIIPPFILKLFLPGQTKAFYQNLKAELKPHP